MIAALGETGCLAGIVRGANYNQRDVRPLEYSRGKVNLRSFVAVFVLFPSIVTGGKHKWYVVVQEYFNVIFLFLAQSGQIVGVHGIGGANRHGNNAPLFAALRLDVVPYDFEYVRLFDKI